MRRIFPAVFLLLDITLTQLSLSLAFLLRQQINLGIPVSPDWLFVPGLSVRIIITIVWIFFLSLFSVYNHKHRARLWAEQKALIQALFISLSVLAVIIFLFDYDQFSRLVYLYFALANILVLVFAHLGVRALRAILGETRRPRRVLVVGTGTLAQEIAKTLIDRGPRHRVYMVGFLCDKIEMQTELLGKPILGKLNSAFAVVDEYNIQEVVVALPAQFRNKIASLFRVLQDHSIQLRLVPDALDKTITHSAIGELAGIELLNLQEARLQMLDRVVRRLLDVIAAALGLVILSPLMVTIAILIKLDSPGTVLFRQTRVGKNGKLFTFYKFRSMTQGADVHVHQEYVRKLIRGEAESHCVDERHERVLKMVDDQRITRIGKILRKSSLDELPQLFNVLKGDMSLVGPRPPIPYEVEEYQEWHKRRLEVTPGITGLWQVRGRSRVSFDEMIQMDIEYIERQSLWLDLKILLLTPLAVITGKGAG